MNFLEGLRQNIATNNSLLCVGLDSDPSKLPPHLQGTQRPVFEFNKAIVDATNDLVICFKPNSGFYEVRGTEGLQDLKDTIDYIHEKGNLAIDDAKRSDIGSTAEMYAIGILNARDEGITVFDSLNADAVTVNPYLGYDALKPFFERTEKGVIVLCRTSNRSAPDVQDITDANGKPIFLHVAELVVEWNKLHGNALMVVGATYPDEMKLVRGVTPDMFFLVPGIGKQGGDLEGTLRSGLRPDGSGLIINSSSGIIFASNGEDFAEAARNKALETRDAINKYRHGHS